MRKLKKKSVLLLPMLVLFGLGFNACKDNEDDQNTTTLTQQDKTFVIGAASSNISEVQFGRLALQKATNDSVKLFAQNMVTEHTRAQAQLDSLAKIMGISVPDSMDAAHKSLYTRLSGLSGAAFDSVYIDNQVIDHTATRTLFQDQISNGKDTRLKSYATKVLPAVTSHLEQATRLRTRLTQKQPGQPGK